MAAGGIPVQVACRVLAVSSVRLAVAAALARAIRHAG
jgi:hypothetical protein